jgi:hypothetical protein
LTSLEITAPFLEMEWQPRDEDKDVAGEFWEIVLEWAADARQPTSTYPGPLVSSRSEAATLAQPRCLANIPFCDPKTTSAL